MRHCSGVSYAGMWCNGRPVGESIVGGNYISSPLYVIHVQCTCANFSHLHSSPFLCLFPGEAVRLLFAGRTKGEFEVEQGKAFDVAFSCVDAEKEIAVLGMRGGGQENSEW